MKAKRKLSPRKRYFLEREGKYLAGLVPMKFTDKPENAGWLHGDFLIDTCWKWHAQGWRTVTEAAMRARVKKHAAGAKQRRRKATP